MSETATTPNPGPTAASRLRRLLAEGGVIAPGSFDAFSAHLVQQAGFPVVYISGLAVEATQYAAPDIGLVTRPEMIAQANKIVEAVDIPVICDADTGFGDGLQIQRSVRQFQRIGVAGIHIEDQASPKQCPTYGPLTVLPLEAAVMRVKTTLAARTNPDFVIIARTDADSVSFEETVKRANEYLEAGADYALAPLVYMEGERLSSRGPAEHFEWLSRLAKEVDGPIIGYEIPRGYTADHMFEAGFKAIISATYVFRAAASAMLQFLEDYAQSLTPQTYIDKHGLDPRILGYELAKSLGVEECRRIQLSFPNSMS